MDNHRVILTANHNPLPVVPVSSSYIHPPPKLETYAHELNLSRTILVLALTEPGTARPELFLSWLMSIVSQTWWFESP